MNYLEQHNLLPKCQFGYRRKRSTEHAITLFTDQIRKAMDKGQMTGAIFVDLSKAFDTISHASVINKLPSYGLSLWNIPTMDNVLSFRTYSMCLLQRYTFISKLHIPRSSTGINTWAPIVFATFQ